MSLPVAAGIALSVLGIALPCPSLAQRTPLGSEKERFAVGFCTSVAKNQHKSVDREKFIAECVRDQLAPTPTPPPPPVVDPIPVGPKRGAYCQTFLDMTFDDVLARLGSPLESRQLPNDVNGLVL